MCSLFFLLGFILFGLGFTSVVPMSGEGITVAEPIMEVVCVNENISPLRVLVFSKTAGFRHDSIPDGIAALQEIAIERNWQIMTTEDSDALVAALPDTDVVVFLSTTGDVMDDAQQAAFEQFIQRGGGFVGIHAASDTEYEWPWYGALVGSYFLNHPPGTHDADVIVESRNHPSTEMLSPVWARHDEWYNFQSNPRDQVNVLMTLDESSYSGGTMGADHPIAWWHEYDGGRAFYTGGGHTSESFSEALFRQHITGGIEWAGGLC